MAIFNVLIEGTFGVGEDDSTQEVYTSAVIVRADADDTAGAMTIAVQSAKNWGVRIPYAFRPSKRSKKYGYCHDRARPIEIARTTAWPTDIPAPIASEDKS